MAAVIVDCHSRDRRVTNKFILSGELSFERSEDYPRRARDWAVRRASRIRLCRGNSPVARCRTPPTQPLSPKPPDSGGLPRVADVRMTAGNSSPTFSVAIGCTLVAFARTEQIVDRGYSTCGVPVDSITENDFPRYRHPLAHGIDHMGTLVRGLRDLNDFVQ